MRHPSHSCGPNSTHSPSGNRVSFLPSPCEEGPVSCGLWLQSARAPEGTCPGPRHQHGNPGQSDCSSLTKWRLCRAAFLLKLLRPSKIICTGHTACAKPRPCPESASLCIRSLRALGFPVPPPRRASRERSMETFAGWRGARRQRPLQSPQTAAQGHTGWGARRELGAEAGTVLPGERRCSLAPLCLTELPPQDCDIPPVNYASVHPCTKTYHLKKKS